MKRTVLKFGLISGLLCSILVSVSIPLEDKLGFDRGYFVGYTIIVLSFLLVFFGIRSYRDNEAAGQISFGKAFGVGISITLITCIFYVVTWEILYFTVVHDFFDKYAAYLIEKARAKGASAAAIQAQIQELQKAKVNYENPFYNAAITFIEPFPVGLAMTLIASVVLRRKRAQSPVGQLGGEPARTSASTETA